MIVSDIIEFLNSRDIEYSFTGDKDMMIKYFCSLDNLKDYSMTWVRFVEDINEKSFLEHKNILLFAEIEDKRVFDFDVLFVRNVHSVFFQVIEHFFMSENPNSFIQGREPSAVILSDNVGENVYVGHHTYIGKNVVIGNNVRILNNVTIQGSVVIGNDCFIDSNTVIGATGFGHYIDNEGNKKTAPHLGGVFIGNNVEIGCNSCIARGCLDNTIIEDGVMIDSMCFVAHNAVIKKGAMIIAGTCVGGSTTVGENSWLGINSTISDQIVVGENTYVGMGTLVNKTLPSNKILVGVPARVLRDNTDESKIKHKNRK